MFPYIDISNRGIEYDEEGQQSWIGWLTDYPITDGSQQANEGYNEFIFTITTGDPDVGNVFDTACVTFYYNVYQATSRLTISDIKIERLTDRVGRTSRTETSPLQLLSLSGRRTWDLKFSYIDDGDLWGSNQSLSTYLQTDAGLDSGDINVSDFQYNILNDDSFFSQVWHKTLGGTLPFIFQPDSSNNNPDQFAICKFKENSLKAEQTAFNVYDISLKIEEVW